MKKIIRRILRLFTKELQILKNLDYILIYSFYKWTMKVRENQILILSDSRKELSGNLAFIDEKIDKEQYDVKYCFQESVVKKRNFQKKKELCKLLALSKYILVDDFIPVMYTMPLRNETRFIQVWHAMGAFKKVGFSRLGKVGGPSPRSLTHRNYTDAIVSAEALRKNYAEAFGISVDKIHAVGIPRTDVFFDDSYKKKKREELYGRYPQLVGKKVILFAPTFRGHGVKTAHYNYEWMNFGELQKSLGKDYICILKMHPFIKNMPEEELDTDFYLNLSSEREINDLLFITDYLITDYSSVIFEASLLHVPTIFYVPDLEEYIETRDFYYPYEEYTYGMTARNQDELENAIKNYREDPEKYRIFKEKFCSSCDGESSVRFVDKFFD